MSKTWEFIAHDVTTVAFVYDGDETLEDLGIYDLKPGMVIIKCHDAEPIDECDLIPDPCNDGWFTCSKCDAYIAASAPSGTCVHMRYCCGCGRKVKAPISSKMGV